jgi:ankyrin repeat protein
VSYFRKKFNILGFFFRASRSHLSPSLSLFENSYLMPFIEVPVDLCCPIDSEIFTDPVIAKCGHSYSRKFIEKWFSTCDEKKKPVTSPATNELLSSRELIPNRELASRVGKFRDSLLTGKSLQSAIFSGDIKAMESGKILKSELNGLFETANWVEGTARIPALSLAVSTNRIEMVKWLLPHVDIEARSAAGNTALSAACAFPPSEFVDLVQLLIDWKADMNTASTSGDTPLHRAVNAPNPGIVQFLISKGSNVHAVNANKRTPLFGAKEIETAKQLVAAGADLFAVDSRGRSALFTVTDPKYFCDLIEFMRMMGGADKLKAASRSNDADLNIAVHAGSLLIPGFIPVALAAIEKDLKIPNPFQEMWDGLARSPNIGSCAALLSRDRTRPPHPHPLTKTHNPHRHGLFVCRICKAWMRVGTNQPASYHCATCNYDECESCFHYKTGASVPDAVECIRVLIEHGGLRFADMANWDGNTPLHLLFHRAKLADKHLQLHLGAIQELRAIIRVVLTLIRAGTFVPFPLLPLLIHRDAIAGASLTIKDKSGQTAGYLIFSCRHFMWHALQMSLPLYDCNRNPPVPGLLMAGTILSAPCSSAAAAASSDSTSPSAPCSSAAAAAASSDSTSPSKRVARELKSSRPLKRVRTYGDEEYDDSGSPVSSAFAASSFAAASKPAPATAAGTSKSGSAAAASASKSGSGSAAAAAKPASSASAAILVDD